MGFLFAKVMREFGIGFDDLLNTPLRKFWFLVNQVDRLRAEADLRMLQLMGSVHEQENFETAFKSLKQEMGTVYVWQEPETFSEIRIDQTKLQDPEFDRAGLRELASLSQLREGQMV